MAEYERVLSVPWSNHDDYYYAYHLNREIEKALGELGGRGFITDDYEL